MLDAFAETRNGEMMWFASVSGKWQGQGRTVSPAGLQGEGQFRYLRTKCSCDAFCDKNSSSITMKPT